MSQKIVRVGNSAAVTIPKNFLREVNLHIGDEIDVQSDKDLRIVVIKPKDARVLTTITPEFKSWLDSFISDHYETLKALAEV